MRKIVKELFLRAYREASLVQNPYPKYPEFNREVTSLTQLVLAIEKYMESLDSDSAEQTTPTDQSLKEGGTYFLTAKKDNVIYRFEIDIEAVLNLEYDQRRPYMNKIIRHLQDMMFTPDVYMTKILGHSPTVTMARVGIKPERMKKVGKTGSSHQDDNSARFHGQNSESSAQQRPQSERVEWPQHVDWGNPYLFSTREKEFKELIRDLLRLLCSLQDNLRFISLDAAKSKIRSIGYDPEVVLWYLSEANLLLVLGRDVIIY